MDQHISSMIEIAYDRGWAFGSLLDNVEKIKLLLLLTEPKKMMKSKKLWRLVLRGQVDASATTPLDSNGNIDSPTVLSCA